MEPYEVEAFWDDLLGFIEQRRVIPIIGAELLLVQNAGSATPLYRAVGETLLNRYNLSAVGELRPNHELNDAVWAVTRERRVRPNDLYRPIFSTIQSLVSAQAAVLEPLRQLASIRDFDLFATTTPDGLLVKALNEERFQGMAQTDEIVHAPKLPTDLRRDIPLNPSSKYTAVSYLFGKADVSAFYAIHDEDALEFAYTLQANGPERMFSKLKGLNLLFIGCTFVEWLLPFFLRSSNSERLYSNRSKKEFLIGQEVIASRDYVIFLQRFSQDTRCYQVDPAAFVAELYERWSRRNPAPPSESLDDVQTGRSGEEIFISYSNEDFGAANRIYGDLKAIGADVAWFDKTDLKPGDNWQDRIRSAIRRCTFFLPLLSASTESRHDGFFHEEWTEAVERSRRILGRKFIFPVVIDREYDEGMEHYSLVPNEFKASQYAHAPSGQMSSDLKDELKQQLRGLRKSRAA